MCILLLLLLLFRKTKWIVLLRVSLLDMYTINSSRNANRRKRTIHNNIYRSVRLLTPIFNAFPNSLNFLGKQKNAIESRNSKAVTNSTLFERCACLPQQVNILGRPVGGVDINASTIIPDYPYTKICSTQSRYTVTLQMFVLNAICIAIYQTNISVFICKTTGKECLMYSVPFLPYISDKYIYICYFIRSAFC